MNIKKMIAGLLCIALGISLCGCGKTEILSEDSTPPVSLTYKTVKIEDNGKLSVTRKEIGSTPMGEEGTWTIFVYMSGSTLEEAGGNGTQDMNEMLNASTGKNVKFIVQTGGAHSWKNDFVNPEKLERYEISDGKRKKLAELPLASMAEASTLRNFLKWGVENHPAAKMGVVFWGHGKGSIEGVCRDDLFSDSFLSLEGIKDALSDVSGSMTDKFEFIGFDNCYMGTVEAADIAATYARYMIGSEELEPANGWNYTVIGDLLGKNPNADWEEIAKTLCDSFYNESDDRMTDGITISVTDLSLLDDVIVKFDDFANDLFVAMKDKTALSEFEKNLICSEHFGEENGFSGYSNTADLGELVKAGSKFSDKADDVLKAIDNAVIYKRAGKDHQNASGLTIYYPFNPRGISEYRTFGRLSISPGYFALTDIKLQSLSPAADVTDCDKSEILKLWCDDRNNNTDKLANYRTNTADNGKNKPGESSLVKLAEEPIFGNGQYTISLDPQTLKNIASVGIELYESQPNHKYNGLGTMPCSSGDWKTGTFSEQLSGKWFLLPNGDPLAIRQYLHNGENAFITQINLKADDRNIFNDAVIAFTRDNTKNTVEINETWVTSGGVTGNVTLHTGSTLSAFYDVYSHKAEKFSSESGTEYSFSGEPTLIYDNLRDGTYYYMVVVTDIYGDKYKSDIVDFSIKNGNLDFSGPIEENN